MSLKLKVYKYCLSYSIDRTSMNNIQYVHHGPYAVSKTIKIITVQFPIFISLNLLFLRDLMSKKYTDRPYLITCSATVQSGTGSEWGVGGFTIGPHCDCCTVPRVM